jgi:hypothetical protein
MAVLIEALSVVIKDSSLSTKYIGGIEDFIIQIPNDTYCTDGQVHRIAFMNPLDVQHFVEHLEKRGLVFIIDGKYIDIVVVDMIKGPIRKCDWLGFAREKFFGGQTGFKKVEEDFSIVWLLPQNGFYGIPIDNNGEYEIAVPSYWTPDKAIYGNNFIPNDEIKLRFIEFGGENGVTKFWDASAGNVVDVGRPRIKIEDRTNRN